MANCRDDFGEERAGDDEWGIYDGDLRWVTGDAKRPGDDVGSGRLGASEIGGFHEA